MDDFCRAHQISYDDECPECAALTKEQPPAEGMPPVPDTNVGNIPGKISYWIYNVLVTDWKPEYLFLSHKTSGAEAMYHYLAPTIAQLTKDRDQARDNMQKLIDDLAAKSDEATAYRGVLEKIRTDAHWMSSEHQEAAQILTKYPQ